MARRGNERGEDGGGSSPEELLYDEFLDAMLEGRPEDPSSFCARNGVSDSELAGRLQQLWRMAVAGGATRAQPEAGEREFSFPAEAGAAPGKRLGDHLLLEVLGGGGMGVVYRARQESLGREVALKVMNPGLQSSASARERFEREARSLARVQHPSIVRVHQTGECDGVRFLAMELVRGHGLDEIIDLARADGQPLPAARVVKWFAQLARALECAHAAGIIHRDIKPSNVVITTDDTPVLIDFGLARDQEATAITQTAAFMGSPAYSAPEQILARHDETDERTDIYALGASLYESLSGNPPFRGETIEQVFHQALLDDPMPLREQHQGISRDLETVTRKTLEKKPEDRYASAAELAQDLEALLEFRPISARPPGVLRQLGSWARRRPGIVGALVAGLAATIVWGVLVAWDRHEEAAERHRSSVALLDGAQEQLEQMRSDRQRAADLELGVRRIEQNLQGQFVPPEDYERLQRDTDHVLRLQRERVEAYYRIQELVRRAQRLDPDVDGIESLLARLHLEKLEEARTVGDDIGVETHRQAVRELDPLGVHEAELTGLGTVDIKTDPPGATVYLFAQREQSKIVPGGEERFVPVPCRDGDLVVSDMSVTPGTWMLEVRAAVGDLRRGDLIAEVEGAPIEGAVYVVQDGSHGRVGDRVLSVDGKTVRSPFDSRTAGGLARQERTQDPRPHHYVLSRDGEEVEVSFVDPAELVVGDASDLVRAQACRGRVYRNGELVAGALPAGLEARVSSVAPLLSQRAVAGESPLTGVRIAPGEILIVVQLAGYETQRVSGIVDWRGRLALDIGLVPDGTSPPGFVPVIAPRDTPQRRYWLMEREVTMEEWVEFLNDPVIQARIEFTGGRILVPRQGSQWLFGRRTDGGTFFVPEGFEPRMPVLGISWDDASAYAEWRTSRARGEGKPYRFALPTEREWLNAAVAGSRRYVYGRRFRPRWSKSCFARPFADPEPVQSFPVDESPQGVNDLGGSAWEWIDGWWEERKGTRRLMGGAWGQGSPENLSVWGGFGLPTDQTTGETGMRLVLHIDG